MQVARQAVDEGRLAGACAQDVQGTGSELSLEAYYGAVANPPAMPMQMMHVAFGDSPSSGCGRFSSPPSDPAAAAGEAEASPVPAADISCSASAFPLPLSMLMLSWSAMRSVRQRLNSFVRPVKAEVTPVLKACAVMSTHWQIHEQLDRHHCVILLQNSRRLN